MRALSVRKLDCGLDSTTAIRLLYLGIAVDRLLSYLAFLAKSGQLHTSGLLKPSSRARTKTLGTEILSIQHD